MQEIEAGTATKEENRNVVWTRTMTEKQSSAKAEFGKGHQGQPEQLLPIHLQ